MDTYDEGVILMDAMRVSAGMIPHRDFYLNYGPAQYYALAGIFRLFGESVLVERIYDLVFRSMIISVAYWIVAVLCTYRVAFFIATVTGLWLFSIGSIASPIIPVLLLLLLGSALLMPYPDLSYRDLQLLIAGMLTGLVALFRYDVGFAVLIVHSCAVLFTTSLGTHSHTDFQRQIRLLLLYLAGTAIVFGPVALLYLALAPIHPFVFDIIEYPTKYYPRARKLPFPSFSLMKFDMLAVYLPLVILICAAYIVLADKRSKRPESTDRGSELYHPALVLFALLAAAMYFKGLVRVSVGQMFLSISPALILLGILFQHFRSASRARRVLLTSLITLSALTAIWGAAKHIGRVFVLERSSVAQQLFSASRVSSSENKRDQLCAGLDRLCAKVCFLVDPDHAKADSYLISRTAPGERIFVGNGRHDKIYENDTLTYFVVDRLPATRWSQFDPLLQSRADIQSEMIGEIEAHHVRYILVDTEFDNSNEPNDSSKSSGVTLLDDYLRRTFETTETFGKLSVWRRKPSPSNAMAR